MLTRRDVLKASIAGLLARFVTPALRRQIDLLQFCDTRRECQKYDLALPYEVNEWTYATDNRVCVRVRPESGDRVHHEGKIPSFGSLSWNHDRLAGTLWRPMPKLNPIVAADASCPVCDGYGHLPSTVPCQECEPCGGTGTRWIGGGYGLSQPRTCKACGGKGHTLPPGAVTCAHCGGDAIGKFPAYVCLDGKYYGWKLYEKVRRLGCEYVPDWWHAMPSYPMAKFRFSEGHGLLMGCEAGQAEALIARAKG